MIIKNRSALLGGALVTFALASGPMHAQGTSDDIKSDPLVTDSADTSGMTAEEAEMEAEMAADKIEAGAEELAADVEAGAEKAGDAIAEGASAATAAVVDAADDDEVASKLQQEINADPELAVYNLDVVEMDGRYSVNGMIDKPEDYTKLEMMLNDIESVDSTMIENNVVVN